MSNQEEKGGATKEEKITTNGEHQEKEITEEDDIPETRTWKEKFAKVEAELEDLRKFKADVEAIKKAQAETEEKSKKTEVNVSNTFFGRDGQTSRDKLNKSKTHWDKIMEELMKDGAPYRHE